MIFASIRLIEEPPLNDQEGDRGTVTRDARTDHPRRLTALAAAAVVGALALGGCAGGKANLDGPEMSDEQTRAQVVDPAKRLVQAVGLQLRGASFRFSACTDQGVAPFRGRVSMGFTFPTGADEDVYVNEIVAAMTAEGWRDGAPEGKQPHGRALHKGEVMAIVTPNPDHPDRGYIRILGECRNAADHSGDDEDIRAELLS